MQKITSSSMPGAGVDSLTSWEVLQTCFERSGKSLREVAEEMRSEELRLRVMPAQLGKWMKAPKTSKNGDFLQRAWQIVEGTKCLFPLQWACGEVGGFFAFNSAAYGAKGTLLPDWFRVTKELHALRGAIVDAYQEDQSFCRDEITSIGRAWVDVLAWVEGFTTRAEGATPSQSNFTTPSRFDQIPFLQSREAVRSAYDFGSRLGCETVTLAKAIGVSVSTVHKWGQGRGMVSAPQGGIANPFDYAVFFCRAVGSDLPVNWLCQKASGFLTRASLNTKHTAASLELSWQQVHCEMAELDFVITTAVKDKWVAPAEASRIRREWEDVKAWMAEFMDWCVSNAVNHGSHSGR